MNTTEKKNKGHSVFQKLLEHARENHDDLNLILLRYGVERFLYRLGLSEHAGRFTLKGASLFLVWKGKNYRVTRDADLLGIGDPDISRLAEVFRDICRIDRSSEDGIFFPPESVQAEAIREDQPYGGIRMTMTATLHNAKMPVQIDVGFGDAVTPASEEIAYPTLLDAPAPTLKAYTRYTVVAEKFEAMVQLGTANSRLKDFYDIWLLSRLFDFDGAILRNAVNNTFQRRTTAIPQNAPVAFTDTFFADAQKKVQWKAFTKKTKAIDAPTDLSEVVNGIVVFLSPILVALQRGEAFDLVWSPTDHWYGKHK